jgi:hypothetical protein
LVVIVNIAGSLAFIAKMKLLENNFAFALFFRDRLIPKTTYTDFEVI